MQGQKSRSRSVESVVAYFREQAQRGVTRYLFTDDNFARNTNWEPLLDGIIKLREDEGIKIDFFIQVDTKATRIPRFVDKAKQAGCSMVFIGIESVHQENVKATGKTQNKVSELQEMILTWKRAGILTQGAVIIGFPTDTPESIEEDVQFIKNNIPLDIYESTIMMPLPGSADHKHMLHAGGVMDEDFNLYDGTAPVTPHPNMSSEEWAKVYWKMWDVFYSWDHIETIFKRVLACKQSVLRVFGSVFGYYGPVKIEKLHPLVCGTWRRKFRTARRYGMPLEPRWKFYPKRFFDVVSTQTQRLFFTLRLAIILVKAFVIVRTVGYTDVAIENSENQQETPRVRAKMDEVAVS